MGVLFRLRWLCWIGCGLCCAGMIGAAWAQSAVVSFAPENPKWGDTLVVKYHPAAAQAKLRGESELYLVCLVDYPDHNEHHWTKLKKEGAAFTAALPVAESADVYSLYFISRDAYDSAATRHVYVSTRAGKPARGANAFKLGNADENYQKYFSEEITLYPDNYTAYRIKWGIDFELRNRRKGVMDGLQAEVKNLRQKVQSDTPELLYALAFGYLLIGQEGEARAYIKQLADKYPKSPLVERAISDYERQTEMSATSDQALTEIRALKLSLADKYPDGPLARNLVRSTLGDSSIRLELIEKITQLWIKAEANHPLPVMALGEAYAARGVQLAKSRELLTRAIALTLDGYLRLTEDMSGHLFQTYLPRLYRARADVNFKSKQYAAALADTSIAADLSQGPARAYYYDFRGHIWEALKYPSRAEDDYILAYINGNSQARESLRALYRKRTGSDKGFQEYLDKRRAEPRDRPPAPAGKPAARPGGAQTGRPKSK